MPHRIACLPLFTTAVFLLPSAASGQQNESPSRPDGSDPVAFVNTWLKDHSLTESSLTDLQKQQTSSTALTAAQAAAISETLWKSRRTALQSERAAEMQAREIVLGTLRMPFWFRHFGEAPADGRSLFISLHGGGGAPAAVNTSQYENQKRLYKPKEGIYLVPRAPTDTWNLWHQGHVDAFLDRLITNMVVFENVNPDKVYLMGYSAGGDGVYQLAPRMADRLAAASMMAGHPNETVPDGLRNIGFTIHVGGRDSAYNRNRIAVEWKTKLGELRKADPKGYAHEVRIHEQRSHWMNLEDAVAVPWMAKFRRTAWPQKIVWKQDDVTHDRLYWLGMPTEVQNKRPRVEASVTNNDIHISHSDVDQLTVYLHDDLVDLRQPITVHRGGKPIHQATVPRTISCIAETLLQRDDSRMIASAKIDLQLPIENPSADQ